MTEEPPTPKDDETPAGEADAPAGGSAEGAEAAAEGQAQGGADERTESGPEEQAQGRAEGQAPGGAEAPAPGGAEDTAEAPAAEAGEPAAEADAPTAEEQPAAEAGVETPAGDTTIADEPGGATESGVNAPDEPAQAPDVVGPEGAEQAGSGAEAGARAAGLDEGPDAEIAERRERPRPSARKQSRRQEAAANEPEVVPGAHLEPDLVLEPEPGQETADEFGAYAQTYDATTVPEDDTVDTRPAEPASEIEAAADGDGAAPAPARTPLDLAADARYPATGKRKTSVARVILKPGTGTYTINGRPLEVFFPRAGLQKQARQPLETAGYESRMDVVARIHGGGVSAQAGALRHGIARALVEADPALRTELKRRGFLTRDARVKERKKAGLKKARKRPQFSKR